MRAIVILIIVCIFTLRGSGIEPEPDWQERFEVIKAEIVKESPGPKVGDRIRIERRVGGDLVGRVGAIESDSITIHGRKYTVSQLTPASARKIFAAQNAAEIARKRVSAERGEYARRHRQEIEARKAQEQQEARETAARLEVQRQGQNQQRAQQARAQPRQRRQPAQTPRRQKSSGGNAGVAALVMIGVVIACILGFLIYTLPVIIAFKRGHKNAPAILALNILLGWTFLGWVAAFVWSMTAETK